MSTRYVWGKYNAAAPEISYNSIPAIEIGSVKVVKACSKFGRAPITAHGKEMLGFLAEGNVKGLSTLGSSVSCSQYPYVILYFTSISSSVGYGLGVSYSGNWEVQKSTSESSIQNVYNIYNGTRYSFDYTEPQDIGKGDFISNQSSQSSSAYPKSGVQGSYFYEYVGSDNIDPTAVSYSVDELYAGEPFEIIVTPRTPTYGGTVYYRYQYSINGGSWTNIGSRTTATSATVTIPEGAEQFQARVLASDGWGFTSSTYVYGPAEEVSQLKTYVGIGGKAGSLKKGYVGVTAKARSLVKGYVGVDGVAKKLF